MPMILLNFVKCVMVPDLVDVCFEFEVASMCVHRPTETTSGLLESRLDVDLGAGELLSQILSILPAFPWFQFGLGSRLRRVLSQEQALDG